MDYLIMKAKLTDASIKKFLPIENERVEIFDSQLPGFGIRIGKREKAFFLVRRIAGQKVRLSLGVYPAVGLLEARAKANLELSKIKSNIDPRAERIAHKQQTKSQNELIFANVTERFTTEYVLGKKKPLRPKTAEGYAWAFANAALKSWQSKPLASIKDVDVIKAIDALEGAGQFASARLLKAYLHRFFRWAAEKRLIPFNPVTHVALASAASDFARERFLTTEELRLVLLAAERQPKPYGAFIKVLLLAGQRGGETSKVKWSDLQLDGVNPTWIIPAENAKNGRAHDVPLSAEMVAVFKTLPIIGNFVFSTDGQHPIAHFSKVKKLLDAEIEKVMHENSWAQPVQPWTWHDLRRSMVTGMGDLGIAPHIVEAIVNHVSGHKAGVAGTYNKSTYTGERRLALAAWSKHVLGEAAPSNVVKLSRT